jgi:hypothetical protein
MRRRCCTFPPQFAVALAAFSLALSARAQQVVTAIYIGPASGGEWSVASNWSTGVVPQNTAATKYNVVVPSGKALRFSMPQTVVNTLRVETGSTVDFRGPLDVLQDANIYGTVAAFNQQAVVRFLGSGSQVSLGGSARALGGGSFTLGTGVLDWKSLPSVDFSGVGRLGIDGGASALRFPNLTLIDAARGNFDRPGGRGGYIEFNANFSPSGLIDMPSLTRIKGPVDSGELLRFTINGTFNAPALASVDGNTLWEVRTDTTLPGLVQAAGMAVGVTGAQFRLPAATTLFNCSIGVGGATNAKFTAPSLTTMAWSNAFVDRDAESFGVSGVGNSIDLPNLRTLDFRNCTRGSRFDVRLGASLNLPALTHIMGPTTRLRELFVPLGDPTLGAINLSALALADGNTHLYFTSTQNASALVPSLARIDGAKLSLDHGAKYDSNVLNNVNNSVLFASGVGSLLRLPGVVTYKVDGRLGLPGMDGNMIETRFPAVIDLPNLTTIDASYDTSIQGSITQAIRAFGGTVRLPNLALIIPPARPNDHFQFRVEGGRIEVGAVALPSHTSIKLDTGVFAVAGDLHLRDDAFVTGSSGQNPSDTFLRVGGSFSYAAKVAENTFTNQLTLQMVAPGDSTLEVGGSDFGIGAISNARNFAFGRLQVGDVGVFSRVRLVDSFDNAPGSTPEALYLHYYVPFELVTSLQILGGSELWIGDLPIYARINGAAVPLRSLIPAGNDRVAFDQGWIVIPAPGGPVFVVLIVTGAAIRRRAAYIPMGRPRSAH